MTDKHMPQWRWYTLIEKDTHLCRRERTPRRMIKHGTRLLHGHTRKPVHELLDRGVIFQVLEQGGHRDASASKHPHPAHDSQVAFDGTAGGPIDNANDPSAVTPRNLLAFRFTPSNVPRRPRPGKRQIKLQDLSVSRV